MAGTQSKAAQQALAGRNNHPVRPQILRSARFRPRASDFTFPWLAYLLSACSGSKAQSLSDFLPLGVGTRWATISNVFLTCALVQDLKRFESMSTKATLVSMLMSSLMTARLKSSSSDAGTMSLGLTVVGAGGGAMAFVAGMGFSNGDARTGAAVASGLMALGCQYSAEKGSMP